MNKKIMVLKKSAEHGDRDAQYDLGCAYLRGEGVRRNRVIALRWLLLASFQGDGDAEIQAALLEDQLTDQQERRALAMVLRWKFRHQLKKILAELWAVDRTEIEEPDDILRAFDKVPDHPN